MNKKGLATGIISILIVLFLFALFSLISLRLWSGFEDSILSLPNETISQTVKDQVSNAGQMVFWGDKIFTLLLVILLISYVISAVTLPVDQPIFFVLFIFVLVFVTITAMILSNAWTYMINQPDFISAASNLTFTNFVLNYFPMIIFIIGIMGALIFYGRKTTGSGNIGGGRNIDGFQ